MGISPGASSDPPPEERLRLHTQTELFRGRILIELDRVLASQAFAQADRPSRFLRFLVEHALESKGIPVNEHTLATTLFNRKASFDPASDPIVRVEAGRLRRRLEQYYATDGREDPITIELPQRTYVPVFYYKPDIAATVAIGNNRLTRFLTWKNATLAAVAIAAVVAGYWTFSGLSRADKPEQLPADAASVARSVVVLPFSDLSETRDQEYFCDGITEELTEALVRIPGLRVVSFTTALHWKHKAEDVREIGKKLNVGLVLEGTVRKNGRRLRIVAQLIDARNGYHIWSRTFDRELQDVFKVQEDIANGVVSANWGTLTGRVPPVRAHRAANLEAYDFYLRGLHAAQQWTTEGLTAAVAQFHRAIEADPRYAAAYAGLAQYYTLLGVHAGLAPAEAMPEAKAAALKALELDNSLAHAHAALALVKSVYEWDWDGAEQGFRQALELDPADDDQRQMYVMGYLVPKGRLDEAVAQMETVCSHDPISTRAQSILGMIYYFQRDYDRAIQQFGISLSLEPHDRATKLALGSAYAQKAKFADAVVALQEGKGVWSAGMGASMVGHAYALMGRKTEAETILRELIQLSAVKYISPAYVAAIYAGLGDRENTLNWLEKAYQVRAASLVFLKVNPRFDLVRSDPRFKDLLSRMRLE